MHHSPKPSPHPLTLTLLDYSSESVSEFVMVANTHLLYLCLEHSPTTIGIEDTSVGTSAHGMNILMRRIKSIDAIMGPGILLSCTKHNISRIVLAVKE